MGKAIKTKLTMWTRWGYRMAPQIFESKSAAVAHAKEMRDNGYIFDFSTSPA